MANEVVIPRSELRQLEGEAARAERLAEENAQLRRELKVAQAANADLEAKVAGLVTLGENLQAQMADLKARLGANSRNSSKPPSSDGPGAPPRGGRTKSGRRRGGQPRHEGTHRAQVAAEDVDEVYSLWPTECAACRTALAGDDAEPFEHQLIEIPDPRVVVTSYLLHTLPCPACGAATRAELPEGLGESAFGPRTHAVVATLVGRFRQSKRSVAELLKLIWGLDVSTGALIKMERRVAAMLGPPVEEARAHLQESESAHGDETGWWERQRRHWLWLGATLQVAVFLIRPSRGGAVAKELFGADYAGTICTDRWSAYNAFTHRALCWAHLLRDFAAMEERHHSPWHGHRLGLLARRILGHLQHWKSGDIDRATLTALTVPPRARFETLLDQTSRNAPGEKARGIARDLLGRTDELWRFLDDPLVHPTNNLAERLLRYAVIYRKLSFGTDSPDGSRYIERLLTTAATLSLQNRNLFDYLTDGMTAFFAGKPAPSLLPAVAEG